MPSSAPGMQGVLLCPGRVPGAEAKVLITTQMKSQGPTF